MGLDVIRAEECIKELFHNAGVAEARSLAIVIKVDEEVLIE